jgi:uncharacterized membrane protein
VELTLQNRTNPKISFQPSQKYLVRVLLVASLTIWCAGILYPILFSSFNNLLFHSIINHNFSLVCHQIEEKTFTIFGMKLLVCSRCTGLYFGAFFVSITTLLSKMKININLKSIFIASFILLLDVVFVSAGLYNYAKLISFTTGLVVGIQIYLLILPILEEYLNPLKIKTI